MSSALKSTTVEIANGNTRSVHNNGSMGFLKSDGNWDMYANNSGQIWAANYGWLHDYFFSAVSNCATGGWVAFGDGGNVTGFGGTISLVDNGATISLSGGLTISTNCNCNCQCNC